MVEHLKLKLADSIQNVAAGATTHIVGSSEWASLAPLLVQHTRSRPQMVVVPNEADLAKFTEALEFFAPDSTCYTLPGFDVGVFSNLYPSKRCISERLRWLHHAQNAKADDIFVATLSSLTQKTLPFSVLNNNTQSFRVGDDLPDDFTSLLDQLGYQAVPYTEDVGHYSFRGGILDVFSPSSQVPVRIELFGNTIDSLKSFDPSTHRSINDVSSFSLIPTREVVFLGADPQAFAQRFAKSVSDRAVDPQEKRQVMQDVVQQRYFQGVDFLVSQFYDKPEQPLEHFSQAVDFWIVDETETLKNFDRFIAYNKTEHDAAEQHVIRPNYHDVFFTYNALELPPESSRFSLEKIEIHSSPDEDESHSIKYRVYGVTEFANQCKELLGTGDRYSNFVREKIETWKEQGYRIIISCKTQNLAKRLNAVFENAGLEPILVADNEYRWPQWLDEQQREKSKIHLVQRSFPKSFRNQEEHIIVLRDSDFLSRRATRKTESARESNLEKVINFTDLNTGDLVVHNIHGVAVYEGLKAMDIRGAPSEFIQLSYKGGDKLYLPIYRISQLHKYAGPQSDRLLDKLGGSSWEKAKTKVKKHLRDIASELLKLYAKRAAAKRRPFSKPEQDYFAFENRFPFDETEDQEKAISEILTDMTSTKPMDRLICGDVGFGKTEVAMRATYKSVEDGRQVAVVAPTTILTFQHARTFKARFKGLPVRIEALNRFIPPAKVKKIIADTKEGKVDILIGTHRLFSRDIMFKDLGLLVIDEEQKFGVKHKEKIRKLRADVDTLTLSATPIPRTLNMSLVGVRDLSLITTPPVDRLPTRTFVCKYDAETIRKAIVSELQRGGQVFFLHNRVMSIEGVAADIREMVPDARIKVAHGQMEEGRLEKVMVEFFNREIDVLVCTTIIESGMDIPRANTMFINNAHAFGLSQLYQLRGRVGRSKERAYCYLLVPPDKRIDSDAQERLRVIQENTALGSGIRVAQHDLELRGSGNLLGEDQSGHINAVGYELYMELLENTLREQKGEDKPVESIEPEINVKIPALIPDKYISDIRIRLSYYKALSAIKEPADLDEIEEDMRDQFGKPPEEVINLMGLMLIRRYCKNLGILDLSSGKDAVSLTLTDRTPLPAQVVVDLTGRPNKKYSITPDNRLKIRINDITWPRISEELLYLLSLCEKKI